MGGRGRDRLCALNFTLAILGKIHLKVGFFPFTLLSSSSSYFSSSTADARAFFPKVGDTEQSDAVAARAFNART